MSLVLGLKSTLFCYIAHGAILGPAKQICVKIAGSYEKEKDGLGIPVGEIVTDKIGDGRNVDEFRRARKCVCGNKQEF